MAKLKGSIGQSRKVDSPSASTPVPGARRSRLSARQTIAPDSESEGDDEIVLKRTLKSVEIPIMSRLPSIRKPTGKVSGSTSPTDTTIASIASSTRANSIDVDMDTPGTTPGTSIAGPSGTKRKRSMLGNEPLKLEDSDDDMALAIRLQKEEYGIVEPSHKKQKGMAFKIEDSEEDESGLSEPNSMSSMDFNPKPKSFSQRIVPAGKGKQKMTAVMQTVKTKLPARSARSSALKSLGKRQSIKIEDSDGSDLEQLSELDSADDFVEEDELTAVSTGVSDTESDVPLALGRPTPSSSRPKKSGSGRGRRFGNHSAADAARIAADIDEQVTNMMMSRKDRERKKLEKSHPTIKTMWKDLKKIPVLEPIQAEQPESINRKLKTFQLEGLSWMTRQEQTGYKGGLLGDEMGMGKTIQAVSLIMSDYPQKQPTLVVVPPVALMQWSTEIAEYTDGKLKVLVYHGQNAKVKGMSVKELKKFDVIMISYNSLESLHRKETKGWARGEDIIKEDSPIHAIHFHRLILDEAHSIKSRTTGVAKACFMLTGTYKWCLSGTPVQNRIGEFFSLLRFLEVRPFADYFCKSCPCSMLHWKLDDDHRCSQCKHSGMEHVSVFNQELLNPLTQSEDPEVRSDAMDKLHMITARIMLRRVKKDYVSSMELPPKEVIVRSDFFGLIERDFSSSIMSNTARQFDTYVSRNVVLNNYANIFGLIMQMRQVANHPDLLLRKSAEGGQNVHVCNICDEVAEEAIRSQCKHDFCRSCVKSYITSTESAGGDPDCPRCHIPLAIDLDQPEMEQDEESVKKSSIINRIKMEDWTSSTKIEMLIYELYKLRSKKQTLKSIVFSQFTSMLQLVEWRLRRAGFNTVMLDGSMTPIQRQRSIEYFMNNTNVEVFLVSLKAGGVALNLTEASRVFIVDPWWNPAAEWQSADRCHRIGQKRPCVITRLCIEDSVESRMVMLQEKKANMINGTINNDKTSMEKLTPEDMQFLFRGT